MSEPRSTRTEEGRSAPQRFEGSRVRPPFAYSLYRKILVSSGVRLDEQQGAYPWLIRRSLKSAVRALQRWYGMHFPARAVGGWWWIWRWRFEILQRYLEWESLAWVRRFVKPGMTVVDMGANVGYYTRFLSELVGPTGRVFAFEPNPENFAVLTHNVSRRRYRNVQAFPFAASNTDDGAYLYISPGHSNHSLIEDYTQTEDKLWVNTIRLDTFLDKVVECPRVDFIKVDVEGAELLALEGMERAILRSPGLSMLMEFNPAAIRAGGSTTRQFLDRIRDLGLDWKALCDDGLLGDLPSHVEVPINLLCGRP